MPRIVRQTQSPPPSFNERASRIVRVSILIAALTAPSFARADDTTQPCPSLEQLSLDTQRLYHHVRINLIRVKLPTPDWLRSINEQHALLQKWGGRLTPQVRELFLQQQQQLAAILHGETGMSAEPATAPALSTQPSTDPSPPVAQSNATLARTLAAPHLILIATGLVIDDAGHAMLPAYIDPQTLNGRTLPVMTGDGRLTTAKLVGSDRPSNLSVLQLNLRDVLPATLATRRPADGSLVMTLTADGGGRLTIWNAAAPEPGLIVLPDGAFAGFSANGRFLAVTACRPIVGQILATGGVHRAVLGVWVRECPPDELLRRRAVDTADPWPQDAGASAMQVDSVEPDSAAAHAGLQRGDLILTAGGQPVEDTATFAAVIATQHGVTPLTILREQQIRTLSVDLLPPP